MVPEGYDAGAFPTFAVTVDIVLLTVEDGSLNVLLVQRGVDPYKGMWALPGGFKTPSESLDDAARRELKEETGVDAPAHLSQLGSYGDPGRDPRTNVVTVAYTAVVHAPSAASGATDAAAAGWHPVARVQSGELPLAFDHDRILADAVDRARKDLEHTGLASAFVGPEFTLTELQQVYEAVWEKELDAANFRRAVKPKRGRSWVESTGERRSSGDSGGRPAQVYRRSEGWSDGPPPVRRPK